MDGCAMGGLFPVTLSDTYMAKIEDDIMEKHQPKFYKRYVDTLFIVVKRIREILCSMT